MLGKSFRRLGDQARDRHDWSAAVQAYREHLDRHPKDAAIWVQFGHALKESGNVAAAEQAYAKALSLSPDEGDTYIQIGHAYKLLGMNEHALSAYKRADVMLPGSDHIRDSITALTNVGIKSGPVGIVLPPSDKDIARLMAETQRFYDPSSAKHVSIVGKFGLTNGIAIHAHAFIESLRDTGLSIQAVDTRPSQSDSDYKASSGVNFAEPENAATSLVSVFTDVIANSYHDANVSKIPSSFLKIAYAVFDASLVPSYWVTRLNDFDCIAVPDIWLVNVLKKSGVCRPIFVLPLALDYAPLDQGVAPYKDAAFTFGCVAGYSSRKNLRALIDTFVDAFGDSPSVRLHIHGALNFSHGFEELSAEIEARNIKNVVLTSQSLSDARYAQLLRSFDVYVNVSKGEGFSITPRQAMYLGIPVILSDNTAHHTLVLSGLVKPVPTASYERAHFEGLEGIDCGYQCVPSTEALRRAMLEAWQEGTQGGNKSAPARAFAERYSLANLRHFYQTLVSPKDVFLGTRDALNDNNIETSDPSLYRKYKSIRTLRKQAVPVSERQFLSVLGHDGGFFSVFNTYLTHLVWNTGRSDVSCVIPDWRVDAIADHRGLGSFTSFCYGQRSDGNLWLKFCHPVPNQDVPVEAYNDPSFFEKSVKLIDFNERNEPNLTYIHAYKLYKQDNFPQWRRWYNSFYKEYIHFRESIVSEVDTFVANKFDADFIIGCHVRHPSHGIEQPGASMPTVELFQQHVIRRTAGLTNWKVFLATDQESVVSAFRAVFGDRLISRSDVARVSAADDAKFKSLDASEQNREGHQIQHLTAANEAAWSTRMGEEVIIDALLLARCDTFIHVTSNIATAVAYMNPDLEMIYCE